MMTCNDCGHDIDRCICGAFSRFKTDPEEARLREFFTCNRMPRAGDEGQRYEVRYTDDDGQEKVMGWTDREDGGGLVASIKAHPVWRSPRVVDRRTADGGGEHGRG